MPLQRLIQLWRVATKKIREEAKEVLFGHAWTSFWVYRSIEMGEGNSHMTWQEWLDQLRLGEEVESPYGTLKEEATAIRDRIMKLFSESSFAAASPVGGDGETTMTPALAAPTPEEYARHFMTGR